MTFEDYLSTHGLEPESKEERQSFYKEYRREYLKNYKIKQKETHVRIERVIPRGFHLKMKNKAKELGIPFGQFIDEGFEAILNQTFILRRKESLQEIELLLSQISNRINLLAFNDKRTQGSINVSDFKQLQKEVLNMKQGIRKAYAYPPTARDFLIAQIERNPFFLEELEEVIINLKNELYAD
ncbi:hypothetical protein ACQY1Q_10460 [Tenacibaculum sp. TC6]|uniref:hypothetical protein n=1 Tax=Tenacibaculum sp. TC6 TaxID=3423223 RepID=UPI003D36ADFE